MVQYSTKPLLSIIKPYYVLCFLVRYKGRFGRASQRVLQYLNVNNWLSLIVNWAILCFTKKKGPETLPLATLRHLRTKNSFGARSIS